MSTRITPLPGALEERFRSPSVSVIDPRPVAALTRDEWVAVVDKYLRDVYGMGIGHPLLKDVTDDHWTGWYTDPDRPTTRILEAASVVAAMALCGRLLPLIAGRGDVWAQWVADSMRSRGAFPEWAHRENRRLIVVNLFGESGTPSITEPEKSETLDKALKRPHIPMTFERPELLMPDGLNLPRVIVGDRLHNDDIPAALPVGSWGFEPPLPIHLEPFKLPPELVGDPVYTFPQVNPQLVPADPGVTIADFMGKLTVREDTTPRPALDYIAAHDPHQELPPPTREEVEAAKRSVRGEEYDCTVRDVQPSAKPDPHCALTDTLAASPTVPIPCPAVVKGELHNTRDIPAECGMVGDAPTPPKPAPTDDKLARIRAWHAAAQAKKGGK